MNKARKKKSKLRYDRIVLFILVLISIIGLTIYFFPKKDKKEVKLNGEEKKNYIEMILKIS